MQPYFPPADQAQSVNLRAALLRSLEQAKKNGTLGRDAIIRKTMLDECRGERLEEVLAVFSSAVLKKIVAEDQLNNGGIGGGRRNARTGRGREQHPAAAKSLALEDRGYTAERTPLNILILAHRVSLSRDLQAKEAARARYKGFAELLDLKQRDISRRHECVWALEGEAKKAKDGEAAISDDARLHVWRVVRNNWSGSEQWMEALLCSDGGGRNSTDKKDKDGLLSTPYDRVWRRVQAGRLSELEGHGSRGLLEQLEKRAGLQHERLQRWEDYRRSVFKKGANDDSSRKAKTASTTASAQEKKTGIDLGFGAHGGLYPTTSSPRKARVQDPPPIQGEYADLVKGLAAELASVEQPSGQQSLLAFLQAKTARPAGAAAAGRERKNSSPEAADEPAVSDISDIDDHEAEEPPKAPPGRELRSPRIGQRMLLSKASMTFSVTTYDSDEELEPPAKQRQLSLTRSRAASGSLSVSGSRSASLALPPSLLAAAHPEPMEDVPIRRMQSPPIWPQTPPAKPLAEIRRLPQTPPVPQVTVYVPDDSPRSPSPSPPRPSPPPEALADRILASMNNASPSPSPAKKTTRHTLSLAQRAQLSMARSPRGMAMGMMGMMGEGGVRFDDSDDDDEPDLSLLPIRRNATPLASKIGHVEEEAHEHEHEDLVARTRRSMAGFEAARQKAQLERRRSQRKSRQLPATPSATSTYQAQFDAVDEADNTILAEELMSAEQDDPEAIFRSRPKIKMSPLPSPTRSLSRAD